MEKPATFLILHGGSVYFLMAVHLLNPTQNLDFCYFADLGSKMPRSFIRSVSPSMLACHSYKSGSPSILLKDSSQQTEVTGDRSGKSATKQHLLLFSIINRVMLKDLLVVNVPYLENF